MKKEHGWDAAGNCTKCGEAGRCTCYHRPKTTKYTFRDFVTGKTRWTRGTFAGWTGPSGLLGANYAIFQRRSDALLVPKYLLTKETKKELFMQEILSIKPVMIKGLPGCGMTQHINLPEGWDIMCEKSDLKGLPK